MAEYLYNTWAPRTSRAMVLSGMGDTSDYTVKAYVVSGVTVWTSFESPVARGILTNLKAQINRFGAKLTPDALIGPKTVDALQKIASNYSAPSSAQSLTIKAMAISPELVAKNGRALYTVVGNLANDMNLPAAGAGGSGGESGASAVKPPKTSSGGGGGGGLTSPITAYDTQPGAGMSTGIASMFSGMSDTTKMVLGAGFVVGAFVLIRNQKKASKKGSGSRR